MLGVYIKFYLAVHLLSNCYRYIVLMLMYWLYSLLSIDVLFQAVGYIHVSTGETGLD